MLHLTQELEPPANPARFTGLTGTALEAVTGVTGAIFCHNARFIAAAATRDAAINLAELAVAVVEG